MKEKTAKLILEDGSEFTGFSFGAENSIAGEIVFNTGMVGYPESFTDPSYKGQMLVLTYPLIGNYGIPSKKTDNNLLKNFESDQIQISALIISDYSFSHDHWNAEKSLQDWLKENNIPALYAIDTRALTKKLREKGTMLGKIIFDNNIEFFDPNKTDLVKQVTVKEPVTYGNGKTKILLIDCGCKNNIIRCFLKRNCQVIRVPYDYDFHQLDFDALFISNGPGDPKMCQTTINNIKKALEKNIPTFGICLGNQLLALAAGADTYKLKYGHRSQNQPCINLETKQCYITSQNHGFAVNYDSIPKDWKPWFVNANDNTIEGIKHASKPFLAVQFHPEAAPGPTDTEFLFDKFLEMLK